MDRINRINLFYFLCALCVLCGSICVETIDAQDYPKEIRGYKVQKTKISVKNKNEQTAKKDDADAVIEIGDPVVEDVSITGVTFELPAEILSIGQSGKIDFLTFKDFRVNGLSVSIEEYKESFSFEKNQPKTLPKPIKIFVGTGQSLLGAVNEMRSSKEEWDVTGTIFVFGKFKKMGFSFKRVVPVEVNIKIKNPIKNKN